MTLASDSRSEPRVLAALLAASAVALPLSTSISALLLAVIALHWGARRLRTRRWVPLRHQTLALALLGYLAWAALSLLWSRNLPHGLQDLRTYAPLLLPVVVLASPPLLPSERRWAIMGLAVGCLLTLAWALSLRLPEVWATGDLSQLFYLRLVAGLHLHAIFLAHFVAAAILLLLFDTEAAPQPRWRWSLIALIAIELLLLASRMSLGALLLTALIGAIILAKREQRRWLPAALAGIVVVGLAAAATPTVRTRFIDLAGPGWEVALHNPISTFPPMPNEFAMRVVVWRLAIEQLNHHQAWLWGVGAGDEQDTLGWAWFGSHLWMYYLYHNAHSQYVQTLLGLGLVGLLLLALIGRTAWRAARGQPAARLWLVFCALIMLTESELVRQHGATYVALMLATTIASCGAAADPKATTQTAHS